MLLRSFPCPSCGAPKEAAPDAIVLVCDYCGAFVAMEVSRLHRGERFAALARRQVEALVSPTAAQARMTTVLATMKEAEEADDRDTWRVACEEFQALMAYSYPDFVPGGGEDGAALQQWHREAVAILEIQTFDGTVGELFTRYQNTAGGLDAKGDPVQAARDMLEAARRYYEAIIDHPDLPHGLLAEGAHHHARELVRQHVSPLAFLLGPGVVEKVRREVLGDETVEACDTVRCRGCGADLTVQAAAGGLVSCPYCGGQCDVGIRDQWLVGTLAIFRSVLDDLERQNKLDGPEPAQSAAVYICLPLQEGGEMSQDLAYAFLCHAVPWARRSHVEEGLRLYQQAFEPGTPAFELIDGLVRRLDTWKPDPAKRPEPLATAVTSPSSSLPPDATDPWVEQSLGWWKMAGATGDDMAVSQALLSYCLLPFQQGRGISADQALAFFSQAAPALDHAVLSEALEPFKAGFDESSGFGVFLRELQERLK